MVAPNDFTLVEVGLDEERGRIVCWLPLTKPTSRVRVKREGKPIATRKVPLQPEDEIEWQVTYDELEEMLRKALTVGLICSVDIEGLLHIAKEQQEFFDEKFQALTEPSTQEFAGFEVWWQKQPILRRDVGREAVIQLEIRHKQRAVGFQTMVFAFVPLQQCEASNLIGRTARQNERVCWAPSKEVLSVLVRAFIIASRTHCLDITETLERLLSAKD